MASGAGGTGGGAGGGKIPTRRCHLRSFQPYQLGRQRHQQSIFSKLTESIKNIVPQWLQNYFSRNEDVCTCSAVRREEPQGLENREDDHLICADEESANIHNGRITPEPTVSNTEDTSTTTTSNCPHVVTRPSLHRSHLNVSISESPALNSEPSTCSFSTGSSRVSLVKQMKDSASQHDNAASENTSVPHLWSMETKSNSFSRHTATSSKNPAFFRRLSQSSGRSSILQTSQLGISRFYPVKIRHGGATAFLREPKVRNTPYQSVSPASAKLYQDDVTSTSPGLVAYMDELALQLDGQHSHH